MEDIFYLILFSILIKSIRTSALVRGNTYLHLSESLIGLAGFSFVGQQDWKLRSTFASSLGYSRALAWGLLIDCIYLVVFRHSSELCSPVTAERRHHPLACLVLSCHRRFQSSSVCSLGLVESTTANKLATFGRFRANLGSLCRLQHRACVILQLRSLHPTISLPFSQWTWNVRAAFCCPVT